MDLIFRMLSSITAVYILFLIKLRWPKKKKFYDSVKYLLPHPLVSVENLANGEK